MKIKSISSSLIGALILCSSLSAIAAPHTKGAYAELNLGTLYANVNLFGFSYSQLGSVGLNTNAGYQFNKNIALEMGYTNYGVSSINNIDGALKVIMPLTINNNDASIFFKIGPAFLFDSSNLYITPFAGIGASYALTDKIDTTIQAQGISEGFFSLGLLSVGLTYHFN